MRHVANYEANKLKKKKWFNTKKEVRYEIWLLFLVDYSVWVTAIPVSLLFWRERMLLRKLIK